MADEGPTRDELYEKATTMGIEGRSSMTKDELADAIGDAQTFVTPRPDQFQERAVVDAEDGEDRVTGEEITEPSGGGVADQSSLTPDTGAAPAPAPPPPPAP